MPNPIAENELIARRRPQPPESLSNETMQWLATLPTHVRPRVLPIEYTRIANTLSRRWPDEHACEAYLDDLLVDRRGNRRGFPLSVVMELATLKDFFETRIHPRPQTVWDDIADRHRSR